MKSNDIIIKRIRKREGVALIVIVGVLALLATIGMIFALNARLELGIAESYINSVKAKYLADGGLACAIAELKYSSQGAINNAIDATTENWYTNPPSVTDLDLGGSKTGDITVTSIRDCTSMINLNDGNPNLQTILTTLNAALGFPLNPGNINQIVTHAPYETKGQLLSVPGIGEAKYNAIKDYVAIWGYVDSSVINPADFSQVDRSPINLNTASQQVLLAILIGIRADCVCPGCGGDGKIQWGHYVFPYTHVREQSCSDCAGTGDLEITFSEANSLSNRIINNRPYRSWSDVWSMLKASAGAGEIGPWDPDLVMANFNPNTGFDPAVREYAWAQEMGYVGKHLDPSDANRGLKVYTTEGSFNSGGYYEIESLGEVKDASGNIIATKKIYSVVKIFDIYRQTTQNEFLSGSFNSNELCTHPEPVAVGIAPADYDGRIMLKVKTPSDSGDTFRAGFTTGFDAEMSAGEATAYSNLIVNNLNDFANPGDLLPDGVIMSVRRNSDLRYKSSGNIPAQGSDCKVTVGMWIKPMWRGIDSMIYGDYKTYETDGWREDWRGLPRMLFQVFGGSNDPMDAGGIVQHWLLSSSDSSTNPDGGISCLLTLGEDDGEALKAICISGRSDLRTWEPGQWRYIEIQLHDIPGKEDDVWAFREMNAYRDGGQYIWPWIQPHAGFDYLRSFDANNTFNIGCDSQFANQVCNCVIDEVRIWSDADPASAAPWYTGFRYNDGRYSTGTFTFTSSTFNLPDDVEWGAISWTESIPNDPNQITDIKLRVDTGSGFGSSWSNPASDNSISEESSSITYRVDFEVSIVMWPRVLYSPILDDVSIVYLKPTEILYYTEVAE